MSFARISPTPSTASSSASVAAKSSSSPPNSATICVTTSFGGYDNAIGIAVEADGTLLVAGDSYQPSTGTEDIPIRPSRPNPDQAAE